MKSTRGVNAMTVHRVDGSGEETDSKSMQSSHLPPRGKGLMQLKGEKKEVTVTDTCQHSPDPQANGPWP